MNNKNNKYQNKNAFSGNSYFAQTQYVNRSGIQKQNNSDVNSEKARYSFAENRKYTGTQNVEHNGNYPNAVNVNRNSNAEQSQRIKRYSNAKSNANANRQTSYRGAVGNYDTRNGMKQNGKNLNGQTWNGNLPKSGAANNQGRYGVAQNGKNDNYHGNQYNQNSHNSLPKSPKPQLTKAQIFEIERQKQIERENRKKRIASAIKRFFMRLAVLFAIYVCLFSACVVFMAVDIFSHESPDDGKLPKVLQIGEDGEKDTISVPVIIKKSPEGDAIYIKMSDIAEKFGFVLTGEKDRLRYVIDNSEDGPDSAGNSYNSVEFINGSSTVYINTVKAQLSGKVFFEGYDDVLVPSEFFSTYVKGITFTFDDENRKLILCRNLIDSDITGSNSEAKDAIRYMPIEFLLKAPVASVSLNEEEVARMEAIGTVTHGNDVDNNLHE